MKHIIREMEELKSRFNHEIDSFVEKLKADSDMFVNQKSNLNNKSEVPATEKFVTVKRLAEIYPAFTQGAIRSMIFSNKWNFEGECCVKSGARKIIIDIEKFEAWIKKPKHKHTAYAHLGVGR